MANRQDGKKALVIHPDSGVLGLPDALEDAVVFDLKFGVALSLFADLLSERVVLARVGCDIGEDGELVDVRVVFGVDVFEFRVERGIAFTRQASESLIDLYVGITDTEVGVVVIAGHPARHGVGDFVGLGSEIFALNEWPLVPAASNPRMIM